MQSSSSTQTGKPWIPFWNNTDHRKPAQPVTIPSEFADKYDDPPVLSNEDSLRAIWYRLTHHGSEVQTAVPGVRLSDGSTCCPLRSCNRSGLMYKPETDRGRVCKVLHMVYPDGLKPFGAFLELSQGHPSCAYRPWSIIVSADEKSWWLAQGTFNKTEYSYAESNVPRPVPAEFKAWKSWAEVEALAKTQLKSHATDKASLMQDAQPAVDIPNDELIEPEDDSFWDMSDAADEWPDL